MTPSSLQAFSCLVHFHERMNSSEEISSDTNENGGSCPPEKVEEALLRCGYASTDQVEGPGQFARRGGILDFFSPGDREPVRIEFWGDDIDSMGHFDTDSQRRGESVESCTILPAAETLPTTR